VTDDDFARLPDDRLYAPEQDLWVRFEAGGLARVGATHFVAEHGRFMVFTPRPVGTAVERDRSLGVMETAKTAVAIHAPISGRIVRINDALVDDVAPVERDPYGEGWMFVVEPSCADAERAGLLAAADYAAWLRPRWRERFADAARPDERDDALRVDPNRGY